MSTHWRLCIIGCIYTARPESKFYCVSECIQIHTENQSFVLHVSVQMREGTPGAGASFQEGANIVF